MKDQFAKNLARQLLGYYGRIPSASILARDFNLRAGEGMRTISQETARRWIRGMSLPELDKLQILSQWLNLEMGFFATPEETIDLKQHSTLHVGKERPINQVEFALLQAFRETDLRGKRILLAVAESLIPGVIPPSALAKY